LTLTRLPSYTNLTRISWRYSGCSNMKFLRQGFRKLSSDRQTYMHTYNDRQTDRHGRKYIPRRFASGQ